jgi:hypothetical protein
MLLKQVRNTYRKDVLLPWQEKDTDVMIGHMISRIICKHNEAHPCQAVLFESDSSLPVAELGA